MTCPIFVSSFRTGRYSLHSFLVQSFQRTASVSDCISGSAPEASLSGKKSALELGLLHVGQFPQVVSYVDEDIVKQYRSCLLLKDYKLNLHIDKSVSPVAQPVTEVSYQLKDKVEEKLDELRQADIIEAVPEGPTT